MEPVKVELEENKEYYFCTCGKGTDGVFCNGSHQGSEFEPKAFSVTKSDEYYLCACKNSSNVPFCDGAHTK